MSGENVKIFSYFAPLFFRTAFIVKERCRSGLTGTPGKRVYLKRVPGVRIPLSPQNAKAKKSKILKMPHFQGFLFLALRRKLQKKAKIRVSRV